MPPLCNGSSSIHRKCWGWAGLWARTCRYHLSLPGWVGRACKISWPLSQELRLTQMAPKCSAHRVLGAAICWVTNSTVLLTDGMTFSLNQDPLHSYGPRHIGKQTWWCFLMLNCLQLKNVKINILLHCASTNLALLGLFPSLWQGTFRKVKWSAFRLPTSPSITLLLCYTSLVLFSETCVHTVFSISYIRYLESKRDLPSPEFRAYNSVFEAILCKV